MATQRHTYDGHDPGGLKGLSMDLPVTDLDAVETFESPILIGKPPEWYCEEVNIELGEAHVAFGPARQTHRIPDERWSNDVRTELLAQFQDDFPEHVQGVDTDELLVGEAKIVGQAELRFKRIDGWRLHRYTFETVEPPEQVTFE